MRIGASRQDDFEINVISLIDVMLTLLMFFVMTTTFVQHSTEASESVQESQHSPLVVMIDASSRFYVDNNEVLNPSIDTLKEAISRIGGDDRERSVVLRADAMTPHQAVVTAMDALGQVGFTHLSIATTPAKARAAK
jgi:biopolymer transport protein ExbD